jgi:GNAT superfamily N-acetyltransferase
MTAQPCSASNIAYRLADAALAKDVEKQWRDSFADVGSYLRLEGGFTIVALDGEQAVGLIAVEWRQLPPPLEGAVDGYIQDIEVEETHRRRGIARRLIAEAARTAAAHGAYQLRAWSAYDRVEAVPMWKALGFGLCPATIISAKTGGPVQGYFVARPLP